MLPSSESGDKEPETRAHERVIDRLILLILLPVTAAIGLLWWVIKANQIPKEYADLIEPLLPHFLSACIIAIVVTLVMKRIEELRRISEERRLQSALKKAAQNSLISLNSTLDQRFQTLDSVLAPLDLSHIRNSLLAQTYKGLISIASSLDSLTVRGNVLACKERLRILNIWVPNLDHFLPAIEDAIQRGVEVEILLAHYYNTLSRSIALQGNGSDGSEDNNVDREVQYNLQHLLSAFNRLSSEARKKLHVRFCYTFPPFVTYIFDKRLIYVGFYWSTKKAVESHQLYIEPPGELFDDFNREFQNLWDHKTRKVDIHLPEWRREYKWPTPFGRVTSKDD